MKNNADHVDNIMAGLFALCKGALISKDPDKWNITIDQDGSYVTKKGMTRKQAGRLFPVFRIGSAFNLIKVTSRKFDFHYGVSFSGMLHFIRNGHCPIPNHEIKKHLESKNPESVFPMILGELREKKNGNKVLSMLDVTKSLSANRILPMKQRPINGIEEVVFNLSDGVSSVDEIISTIKGNIQEYVYGGKGNRQPVSGIYRRYNWFQFRFRF